MNFKKYLNTFITTSVPYSNCYKLIQYNDKTFRLINIKYKKNSGYELQQKFDCLECDTSFEEWKREESLRVSLTRTKSRIRELALCNNFTYFGTITVNGYFCNRYELDSCQHLLKKCLKKIKRNNKDFRYLIITEKHKDNAFHFHGLFSGIELSHNSNGYLCNDLLSREIGYNSFSIINDYNKTCNYITKYITKDCVKNSHNQIFLRSKRLTSCYGRRNK